MKERSMEIGEVRLSLTGGKVAPERSQRISQLTFDHVHRLMNDRLGRLSESVELNYVGVPPVNVRFDVMDDESIAREGAFQIYRALLQEL